MRDENGRMQQWLGSHGIRARVKRIWSGSLKGTWRLYEPMTRWSVEMADRLTKLGFKDFDGRPLSEHSGNGGIFSVFVRGHEEMVEGDVVASDSRVAAELVKIAKELTADMSDDVMEKIARRNGVSMAADVVIGARTLSVAYALKNAMGGSKADLQKRYFSVLMDEMVRSLERMV